MFEKLVQGFPHPMSVLLQLFTIIVFTYSNRLKSWVIRQKEQVSNRQCVILIVILVSVFIAFNLPNETLVVTTSSTSNMRKTSILIVLLIIGSQSQPLEAGIMDLIIQPVSRG